MWGRMMLFPQLMGCPIDSSEVIFWLLWTSASGKMTWKTKFSQGRKGSGNPAPCRQPTKSPCVSLVTTVHGKERQKKDFLSSGLIKQAMMMGGGQVPALFPVSTFRGFEEGNVIAECWDVSSGTEFLFLSLCSVASVLEVFFSLFVLELWKLQALFLILGISGSVTNVQTELAHLQCTYWRCSTQSYMYFVLCRNQNFENSVFSTIGGKDYCLPHTKLL